MASLRAPPPSQTRLLIFHFVRSQRIAAGKFNSFFPKMPTSSASDRKSFSFLAGIFSEVSRIMGEWRFLKISALGSSVPEPLTTMRRLYSGKPLRSRRLRYVLDPGPRVVG